VAEEFGGRRMSMSNAFHEYPDAPARTVENAQNLLGQALEILDQHKLPAEIRARLHDVIESVASCDGQSDLSPDG
jgi:hypothetical protein